MMPGSMGDVDERELPGAARIPARRYALLALPALLVVLLDQVVKAAIVHWLPLYQGRVVIPGFFHIVHVRNTGGAFSLFAHAGSPWHRWLFVGIGALALMLIVYLYRQVRATDIWGRLGLGLIFGGAVGNLIDRLRYGEVVDFLDFYLGAYHWPAFNVADAAISLGAVAIVWTLLRSETAD